MARRSEAKMFMEIIGSPLLRNPRQRNPQLARLSIEIRTLDAQRLGSVGHPPAMMLQNGGDVIAFEAEPGIAEAANWNEGRCRTLQLKHREQLLDLNGWV